jgi:hypothetical protein
MKLISSMMFAAAVSLSGGTAIAACPDTNKTGAIAKDGTHAPLETPDKSANTIAKDGGTMPLAGQERGGNKDLATSQQDVEAQQDGKKTAAATAEENDCKE